MSRSARSCPACGQHSATRAFVVREYAYDRCVACRTCFVDPPPGPEVLAEVYGRRDYYDTARQQEQRLRREADGRAATLVRMGVHAVLEIGCAAGYFLDAARARGLRVEGVAPGPADAEPNPRGHVVHQCWLEDLPASARRFDAVVLWEVIEHASEPLTILSAAVRHLAPGGVVALSTPSMSGLPARLLGRRFPMVTPPEHLTLMTRSGLACLLERAQVHPTRWTSFSNLGPDQLASGLRRFLLGASRPASTLAAAVARAGAWPASLMDRAGWGSEFEVYGRYQPVHHEVHGR